MVPTSLMLVDGHLARLHVCGLFDPADRQPPPPPELGVAVVDSHLHLTIAFDLVLSRLSGRLGPPRLQASWQEPSILDGGNCELRYAAWENEQSVLVLLLDTDADAHIGELGAVDLRIAPRRYVDQLPASVREPFTWPVEY